MKNENLTKYIIVDRNTMEEKRSMELTDSEYNRIIVGPKWWWVAIVIAVIVGAFATLLFDFHKQDEEYTHEIDMLNEEIIISERNNELYCLIGEYALLGKTKVPHDTIVYEFIKQTGAWYPDVIMAQWVIESAHGTSDVFINANNAFGMRVSRNRTTICYEDRQYSGYAVYRNWQYSVLDRVLWELHVFDTVPSKEDYLNQLGYIYAEDKGYVNKIKSVAAKWRNRDLEKEKALQQEEVKDSFKHEK